MSLHVSGQEAQSCLKFLERAMQRWEAEQASLQQLTATRDRTQRAKLKRNYGKEARQRKWAERATARRVWTDDQISAIRASIEEGQSIRALAQQLGVPYSAAWQKHAELVHERNRANLASTTQSQSITHSQS
jgi:hypothetical protein